jgi:hypothetical protein
MISSFPGVPVIEVSKKIDCPRGHSKVHAMHFSEAEMGLAFVGDETTRRDTHHMGAL